MAFELLRIAFLPDGALGVLKHDGRPFAVTLEHTYENNTVKIPEGSYKCPRRLFHHGGYDTYEIPVDGHSAILFHRGNLEDDSDGCVLVGDKFGILNGRAAVLDSMIGFAKFMREAALAPRIDLVVRNVEGA